MATSASALVSRFQLQIPEFTCLRKWQPTPVFFLVKSHGQRNLACQRNPYSPWGRGESDMTEKLNNNKASIVFYPKPAVSDDFKKSH